MICAQNRSRITAISLNIVYLLRQVSPFDHSTARRGFAPICRQTSILSSVQCNFHCRSFCVCVFNIVPPHRRAKKWFRGAQVTLTLNIWSILEYSSVSILLQIENNHRAKKKSLPTFDFLIFKLGLLGSSGPLNQVLMLNDAILTTTRFNSFFRSRLLSVIHKWSLALKGESWNILSSWSEEDI